MIVHIALFQWKKGTKEKEINKILGDIRALREIKGINNIHCGENFSRWAEGYTHAVVVLAKNTSALKAYMEDPVHKKIIEKIEKAEKKSMGIDFEE
ncbi:MAG: Dabb family protein [Candidatus Aenigmarchaeota archaeon]|nr:Dabb family protein [Candidatus Aenigmarchaeota archaeon]